MHKQHSPQTPMHTKVPPPPPPPPSSSRGMNEMNRSEISPAHPLTTWLLQNLAEFKHSIGSMLSPRIDLDPQNGPAYLFAKRYEIAQLGNSFLGRFSMIPYLTYRKDFVPIGNYTSDTGWGCMLRTAQMMLCEALLRLDAVCTQGTAEARAVGKRRDEILTMFCDDPTHPFSLHKMTERGLMYGKLPGAWYEPTSTLLVVKDLLDAQLQLVPDRPNLVAIVARDGVLDISQMREMLSEDGNGEDDDEEEDDGTRDPLSPPPLANGHRRAVFVLIPIRLGLRELNERYVPSLLKAIRFPQSVGFIGGRPSHSLYFVGSQNGARLVYLDPHVILPSAKSANDFPKCLTPSTLPIADLDPSLALGFIVFSKADFADLKSRVQALKGPAIFEIVERASPVVSRAAVLPRAASFASDVSFEHVSRDDGSSSRGGDDKDDEFVLI